MSWTATTCLRPKSKRELSEAKHLALLYHRAVKARSIYSQPWALDEPVERQRVFSFFVKAARIVKSIEADPAVYVKAQFECWNGPSYVLPAPSQLISPGAFQRYNDYLMRTQDTETTTLAPELSTREGDRLLMRRYKAHHEGWSSRKILREFGSQFSREYLERHGLWDAVKADWMNLRE
jgi:hypothetical protein